MPVSRKRKLRQVLAKNVRRLRTKKGLSQTELADMAISTQKRISHLESGKVAITIDTLEDLAAALQTTPEELIKSQKSD